MYKIEFKDVWKQFRKGGRISSIRDLARLPKRERFWALKGVSFQVNGGEIFGTIGPNGAGKTTILRLIARILAPNRGEINVAGKVSTLIELGAGFHPELTGRENIWINASILGMPRSEIREKYDKIVKFSGLESFIDTPVKRYSTGMFLRLGFSIAAHVDFDVLLIDEVVAVGDIEFRQRCWERVREFKKANKTIVIVSHNFGVISSLCDRTLYLDQGEAQTITNSDSAIRAYQDRVMEKGRIEGTETIRVGTREVEITEVSILNFENTPQQLFNTGELLKVKLHYLAHKLVPNPVFCIFIRNREGVYLSSLNTKTSGFKIPEIKGEGVVEVTIPQIQFMGGNYLIGAGVTEDRGEVISSSMWHTKWYDYHHPIYPFTVKAGSQDAGIFSLKGKFTHIPT